MFALKTYGNDLEKIFGNFFLPLYLISGLVPGVFIHLFSSPEKLIVGASGAISGLVAARIVAHYFYPKLFKNAGIIPTIVDAVLLLGMGLLPFVSGIAHLWGFATGLIFSCFYFILKKKLFIKFTTNIIDT